MLAVVCGGGCVNQDSMVSLLVETHNLVVLTMVQGQWQCTCTGTTGTSSTHTWYQVGAYRIPVRRFHLLYSKESGAVFYSTLVLNLNQNSFLLPILEDFFFEYLLYLVYSVLRTTRTTGTRRRTQLDPKNKEDKRNEIVS